MKAKFTRQFGYIAPILGYQEHSGQLVNVGIKLDCKPSDGRPTYRIVADDGWIGYAYESELEFITDEYDSETITASD